MQSFPNKEREKEREREFQRCGVVAIDANRLGEAETTIPVGDFTHEIAIVDETRERKRRKKKKRKISSRDAIAIARDAKD